MKLWETMLIWTITGFGMGAWLWTWSLNTWLVYAGKEATVTWFQGGVIGMVTCPFTVLVAVVTWIAKLFLM